MWLGMGSGHFTNATQPQEKKAKAEGQVADGAAGGQLEMKALTRPYEFKDSTAAFCLCPRSVCVVGHGLWTLYKCHPFPTFKLPLVSTLLLPQKVPRRSRDTTSMKMNYLLQHGWKSMHAIYDILFADFRNLIQVCR